MCTTIQKSGIFCEESSCSCSHACRSVSMFSQKAAPDGLNALSFTFLSLSPISSFLRTRRLVIMESAPDDTSYIFNASADQSRLCTFLHGVIQHLAQSFCVQVLIFGGEGGVGVLVHLRFWIPFGVFRS